MFTSLLDSRAHTDVSQHRMGYWRIAALLMVLTLGDASAQTATPPPVAASASQNPEDIAAAEAMKRSRRQAENPYRWIKIHSETKRKPEPTKPEPIKVEPAKPRPKPEPVIVETTRPVPPRPAEPIATRVVPEAARPTATTQVVDTPPVAASVAAPVPTAAASSVVAPIAAEPEQTAATSPPAEEEDDLELKPISTPPPEFPRDLLNSVNSGRVTVKFTVKTDGTVGESSAEFSTNRGLSRAALSAVDKWTFQPLSSAVTYKVEFDFKR